MSRRNNRQRRFEALREIFICFESSLNKESRYPNHLQRVQSGICFRTIVPYSQGLDRLAHTLRSSIQTNKRVRDNKDTLLLSTLFLRLSVHSPQNFQEIFSYFVFIFEASGWKSHRIQKS